MGEKIYCGLDLGGQTIKASLLRVPAVASNGDPARPMLMGVYETKTAGFKDGAVTDLSELSESIHTTIAGLTNKTGLKLKELNVGFSGKLVQKRLGNAVVPLVDRGTKMVGNRDIAHVQHQARLLGIGMDEEVLHDFPQQYKVDDANRTLNPRGLFARKIELHSLLIVTNSTLIKNLNSAVNEAGFDVTRFYYSPLASNQIVLDDYHKRQGCIILDIGTRTTEVLVFQEGQLRFMEQVNLGGEDVTVNIAKELNLSFDLAEDLKRSYAFAVSSDSNLDEEILIRREDGYVPIKKAMIALAIEAVVGKWIRALDELIKHLEFNPPINAGVIMIGGGALLPGLAERLEEAINLNVKIGKVPSVVKRLNHAAKYASVVGLAQMGVQQNVARLISTSGSTNKMMDLMGRIKELYQEYF